MSRDTSDYLATTGIQGVFSAKKTEQNRRASDTSANPSTRKRWNSRPPDKARCTTGRLLSMKSANLVDNRSHSERAISGLSKAPNCTRRVPAGMVADRLAAEALIVDVDGFEGPLDLLLTLSRTQKVDLRKISVLGLAEQYMAFINEARALRIELAADYLVMAAWLAFLKSRLLLPPDPEDEGPSGEDLAAHLAFQLERLAAMREAAAKLMARDQIGRDFFVRGIPENVSRVRKVTYEASILDLMQAYARLRTRDEFRPYACLLYTSDAADE